MGYRSIELGDLTLAYLDRLGSCWGTNWDNSQTDIRAETIKRLESGKPQEKVVYKVQPGHMD